MAQRLSALRLATVLVVVALTVQCGTAQTSGCAASISTLTPCLRFATGNASAPTSSCCSALAGVLQSAPRCLCAVLGGSTAPFGITINTTRALELPGSCKMQTPSINQCNAVGAPAASPSGSSAPATTSPTATPTATAEAPSSSPPPVASTTGAGSKTTPTTTTTISSDAGIDKSATISISVLAALASLIAF